MPGFELATQGPIPNSIGITENAHYNVTIVVETDKGNCSLALTAFS